MLTESRNQPARAYNELASVALAYWLAATLAVASPLRLEATASPLEGSRWQVKMTPEESGRSEAGPFEDTLVFEGGRVRSATFEKAGFGATPYSLVSSPAGWSLRAVQTSEAKDMCIWTFVIEKALVHGTVTCTRKGHTGAPYVVEGKKIEKEEQP